MEALSKMLLSYSQQYMLLPYCKGFGIEIGCGKKKSHPFAIGIDLNPNSHAQYNVPGDQLPFADRQLDYLVSSHCIEHIADKEKVAKEWHRVLKIGGVCAFITPDINSWKDLFYGDPTHISPYSLDEVRRRFSWGFQIQKLCNFEYSRGRKNILFVGVKSDIAM